MEGTYAFTLVPGTYTIGRISVVDVEDVVVQCAYRSVLYYFNCCAMVRYAVHEQCFGAAQNGIVGADTARRSSK